MFFMVLVMIQSIDSESPEISGASLNSTYVFEQLHFHWGNNDSLGSEDLINNHSYSMEMHAVFWKKAYGTYDEAIKHDDGLSVLGYWYQVYKYQILTIIYCYAEQIPICHFIGDYHEENGNLTINSLGNFSKYSTRFIDCQKCCKFSEKIFLRQKYCEHF